MRIESTNVRKNKRTIKCDKRTITYDVRIAQCEDQTVKCEKKIRESPTVTKKPLYVMLELHNVRMKSPNVRKNKGNQQM